MKSVWTSIRHAADWHMFWGINGKIFGVIGVAVTIFAAIVKDLTASRDSLVVGLAAAFTCGASYAFWHSRVSKNATWVVPAGLGRVSLRIRKGDLFDPPNTTDKVTVITMNRRFGLTTPDVEKKSLISQVAAGLGGPAALRRRAAAVPFDSDQDLPMGTIHTVSVDDRRFALLGMVRPPMDGAEASELPVGDLWQALAHLWQWARDHKADLIIPVIGSGRSGSSLGHELLMALIVLSLVTFLRDNKAPSRDTEVEMVISDEDWEPERVDQLAHLLTNLGFTRKR